MLVNEERFLSVDPNTIIDSLEVQNKSRRRESQGLNLQLLSLIESSSRLEKATQETLHYVKELEQILVKPSQEKHDNLLLETMALQLEHTTLNQEIQTIETEIHSARSARRAYGRGVAKLLHMAQHRAWCDGALLAAINELPTIEVMTDTPSSKVETEMEGQTRSTSLFGWW